MKTKGLPYCLALALSEAIAHSEGLPGSAHGWAFDMKTGKIEQRIVSSVEELVAATRDGSVNRIAVSGDLAGLPAVRLSPGQTLTAAGAQVTLHFKDEVDGIQLSSNNTVENLQLVSGCNKRIIFNDTSIGDFGRLELRNLTLTGVVQLIAADSIRAGHVEAHQIDILSADARAYNNRPKAYGVEVITGAFTLWNRQPDSSITITADLTGISAGRPEAPVRGSGVFVSGSPDTGGKLLVHRLETGPVYSDAGIPEGTPDRISGGVFIAYGVNVGSVRTTGTVATYGPNDMALDNWGAVDHWLSEEKITSHGPSGIGMVNFGTIKSLVIKAPIETFGQGARGFNVYAGTIGSAEFDRIVTHGNGAVGIQIGHPVGEISVLHGIETFGGSGDSLVKGVMTKLSAIAFSVKPEGTVRALTVAGGLVTHGQGVSPLELQGSIESLVLKDGVTALNDKNEGSMKTN